VQTGSLSIHFSSFFFKTHFQKHSEKVRNDFFEEFSITFVIFLFFFFQFSIFLFLFSSF